MSIPKSDSVKCFIAGLGQESISTSLVSNVVNIILHFIEKCISAQKRFFVNSEKLFLQKQVNGAENFSLSVWNQISFGRKI
jgi:hypothetical protein